MPPFLVTILEKEGEGYPCEGALEAVPVAGVVEEAHVA